jgi:hypothetical protein
MAWRYSIAGEVFGQSEDILQDANGEIIAAGYLAPLATGVVTRIDSGLLCAEFARGGMALGERGNVVFRNQDREALDADYFFIDDHEVLWAFDVEPRVASFKRFTREIDSGQWHYAQIRDAVFEMMTASERLQVQ